MSQDAERPVNPIGSDLVKEDAGFADIVTQFVTGLSGHVHGMQAALNKADFDALKTSAHQLKGSGGGYGYPVLTEHAAALERHAAQRSLLECEKALDELKAICERIVPDAAT